MVKQVAEQAGPPLVSVIIPHLNQEAQLAACLGSLAAQNYPRERMEWIVVDNGSAQPPSATIRRFAGAFLLAEPEPGPGLARNRGAAAAKGEILAFIDADCRAHPDWVRALADGIRSRNGIGPIGGDVRVAVADPQQMTSLEAYESVFAYDQRFYIARHGYSGTGNLAMAPSVYRMVGPFAGIGMAEDVDWGRRAAAVGHPVSYAPGMIVFHPARACFSELEAKWRRHVSHQREAHRARGRSRVHWYLLSVLVLVSALPHILLLMQSPRLSGLRNRLRGIPVLFRIRAFRFFEMLRQSASAGSEAARWNRE